MASRPVSPSLTRSTTATDSTGNLNLATATWTLEQEARLGYCQGQLKQAQKKWSDRQELWIREVEHLLELKRAHKKALKKQKSRTDKARRKNSKTAPWRPLSRSRSNADRASALSGAAVIVDGDDGGDDDDDDDGGAGAGAGDEGGDEEGGSPTGMERRDSLPRPPSLSSSTPTSPPTPTTTPTTTGRNPFKKIIRRMSSAGPRAKDRGNSVADADAEAERG